MFVGASQSAKEPGSSWPTGPVGIEAPCVSLTKAMTLLFLRLMVFGVPSSLILISVYLTGRHKLGCRLFGGGCLADGVISVYLEIHEIT